jgi:hypothetical protein
VDADHPKEKAARDKARVKREKLAAKVALDDSYWRTEAHGAEGGTSRDRETHRVSSNKQRLAVALGRVRG